MTDNQHLKTELKTCPHCDEHLIQGERTGDYTFYDHPKNDCFRSGKRYPAKCDDYFTTLWNTRAAPRVKPLEWMPDKDDRGFIAVTSVGQLAVFDEGCPRWAFSGRYNSGYRYFKTDTFEQAKAAAQLHYENLIREALEK